MQCIYLIRAGRFQPRPNHWPVPRLCVGGREEAEAFTASMQITSLDIARRSRGAGLVVTLRFLSYKVRAARTVINLIFIRKITMADIFAAVDLSTVAAFITATGVAIVGIAMGLKGITLAKRAVNKA